MHMHASARSAGGELRARVDVNGRHEIVTDEPVRLGGTDAGPAPHELLPAAVAACVATTLSMYARTKGWSLAFVDVDVDYDPEAVPRRLAIDIHLPGTLTSDQVRRLRRVAAACPIQRSLQAGFEFDERIVLDPPGAPRAAA